MFLATTADERFWKKDSTVLFLGEWCRIYSKKSSWEGLDFEVLPYHWSDRKKLYDDYLYLSNLYEKVLLNLTNSLNIIHGECHSTRYWRIVVGPWLYNFIQILYDRYSSISVAELSGKVSGTYIHQGVCEKFVPVSFYEFIRAAFDDDYNYYVFSRIIEKSSKIPWEAKQLLELQHHSPNQDTSLGSQVKNALKSMLIVAGRFIPSCLNKIVFVSTYLTSVDLLKLQLSLGQLPYIIPPKVVIQKTEIDWVKRAQLGLECGDECFEKLLSALIGENIPQCYIESYDVVRKEASKLFPKNPSLIFTANACFFDEGFKLWAASCTDKGCQLLGHQHGGLYGIGKWSSNEDHESAIYDRYYSWGWTDPTRENIRPLAAAKLNNVKSLRNNPQGRILLTNMDLPRYSYTMLSFPVSASDYRRHLDKLFALIMNLDEQCRNLLLVRLFPNESSGCCQKEIFVSECPNIECYDGSASMYQQMEESRLFIGTYNATTYIEAFVADIPTILFWNPDLWEIRNSALPYFNLLFEAGIYHKTPESAASKINEIYNDTLGWWRRSEVQIAKNKFCQRFALSPDEWREEWKNELSPIVKNLRKTVDGYSVKL